jgi:hypothetical protein
MAHTFHPNGEFARDHNGGDVFHDNGEIAYEADLGNAYHYNGNIAFDAASGYAYDAKNRVVFNPEISENGDGIDMSIGPGIDIYVSITGLTVFLYKIRVV